MSNLKHERWSSTPMADSAEQEPHEGPSRTFEAHETIGITWPRPTLFVFHIDDNDYFVAESEDELQQLYAAHYGASYLETNGMEMTDIRMLDPQSEMTVEGDDGAGTRGTAASWAASNGKGYLCSSDY